jgi:hypothetical protein
MSVNVRIGPFSRVFAPGYCWCYACGTAWKFVDGHVTHYTERDEMGRGCFPLCEKCWGERTPEQRLPFYRRLWELWNGDGHTTEDEWVAIRSAVMAGL